MGQRTESLRTWGRSLARDDTEQANAQEYSLLGIRTGSRIYYNGYADPYWRDEEIPERVKIPVDERLGGCRGFKSHRPHQLSDELVWTLENRAAS